MSFVSKHPLYRTWQNMKTRCYRSCSPRYVDYGGRGIKMSERWLDFDNFLVDMGSSYYKGASIERIDNNGDYELDNCKWIDKFEQGSNKRNNRIIEFSGKSLTLSQWARDLGIRKNTLRERLDRYGWSIERALTSSTRKRESRA